MSSRAGTPGDEADRRASAAKARRAARKAERAAKPVPTRDTAFDALSLPDLRALRTRLQHEETHVSYWRRIIQGRLDVVRSDRRAPKPVVDLTRVLSEAQRTIGRGAFTDIGADDTEPLSSDLTEVWSRQVRPDDAVGLRRLQSDLERAESELSGHRREIHRQLDRVTDELVARYRQQPRLALDVLHSEQR